MLNLPVWDPEQEPEVAARAVLAAVEGWVSLPALSQLVQDFGGTIPAGSLQDRIDLLADFASHVWDFRLGRERQQIGQLAAQGQDAAILAVSEAFGLFDRTSVDKFDFDYIVVLGGTVKACDLRFRLADDIASRMETEPTVIALASERPLSAEELELASLLGLGPVSTEFDAMVAVSARERGSSGTIRQWEMGSDRHRIAFVPGRREQTTIWSVAAPRGMTRARTIDAYRTLGRHALESKPLCSVLVVTSAIYVPYQHMDALTLLAMPYSGYVSTVGSRTEWPHSGSHLSATHYLQEIGATLRSMRVLFTAANQFVDGQVR